MKQTSICGAIAAIFLTGCAFNLKPRMTEEATKSVGKHYRASQICASSGYLDRDTFTNLTSSRERLLSTVKYNDRHLEAGSTTADYLFDRGWLRNAEKYCSSYSKEQIQKLIVQYDSLANDAIAEANSIGVSSGSDAAYIPSPAPVYTPTPMPGPAGQPTFGLPQSDTTHIYENGNLTSCTTTSSGMVICN